MQIKKYIVGITDCKAASNQQAIKCFIYNGDMSIYENCAFFRIKIISVKIISEISKTKAIKKYIDICQRR